MQLSVCIGHHEGDPECAQDCAAKGRLNIASVVVQTNRAGTTSQRIGIVV